MSNSRARRHYRVAEREAEQAPHKGTFITNEKKSKLFVGLGLLAAFLYIDGLVMGYLFGKRRG